MPAAADKEASQVAPSPCFCLLGYYVFGGGLSLTKKKCYFIRVFCFFERPAAFGFAPFGNVERVGVLVDIREGSEGNAGTLDHVEDTLAMPFPFWYFGQLSKTFSPCALGGTTDLYA